MSDFEIWSLIIRAVALTSVIVAIIFGVRKLDLARQTTNRFHEWNRRNLAFAQLSELGKPEQAQNFLKFAEAFDYFASQEAIPLETINSILDSPRDSGHSTETQQGGQDDDSMPSPPAKQNLSIILLSRLNTFENIASGVHHQVLDEKLIQDQLRKSMARMYKRFENYILSRRENNPTFCERLEGLLLKWDSEDVQETRAQT